MRLARTKQCRKCKTVKPLSEFYKRASHPDGRHSWCKPCMKERSLKWHYENPKKRKAIMLKWRKKHPEKERESGRRWREKNREKSLVIKRKWCKKNPERVIAKSRKWRRKHLEQAREISRNWNRDHPVQVRESSRRRRALKTNATGAFTENEFRILVEEYGNRCLRCSRTDQPLVPDHIIPLFHGGCNFITNIQPLCVSCNSKKALKHTDYRKEQVNQTKRRIA